MRRIPAFPATWRIAWEPAARASPPGRVTPRSIGGERGRTRADSRPAEAESARATLRDPTSRPGIEAGSGRTGTAVSARPARQASGGQLALELPLELPPIALAPEWKDQQRLWEIGRAHV